MRLTGVLLFLAAVPASLAQIPHVPTCSANCFLSALGSDGCSSFTDFNCHCQNPDLFSQITSCVDAACPAPSASAVSSIIQSECSSVGHPLPTGTGTVPAATTSSTPAISEASTTASASSSSTGNSSVSSSATAATTPRPSLSVGSTSRATSSYGSLYFMMGLLMYLVA